MRKNSCLPLQCTNTLKRFCIKTFQHLKLDLIACKTKSLYIITSIRKTSFFHWNWCGEKFSKSISILIKIWKAVMKIFQNIMLFEVDWKCFKVLSQWNNCLSAHNNFDLMSAQGTSNKNVLWWVSFLHYLSLLFFQHCTETSGYPRARIDFILYEITEVSVLLTYSPLNTSRNK